MSEHDWTPPPAAAVEVARLERVLDLLAEAPGVPECGAAEGVRGVAGATRVPVRGRVEASGASERSRVVGGGALRARSHRGAGLLRTPPPRTRAARPCPYPYSWPGECR
ncbi:hypothetical protein [Nonomuraea sp. NPDC049784]|uniref:hypothetical protein n=1 Tax=Nonomuraea sp. NPDC049784 TaxID=3154361 RepID=UPI0033F625BD